MDIADKIAVTRVSASVGELESLGVSNTHAFRVLCVSNTINYLDSVYKFIELTDSDIGDPESDCALMGHCVLPGDVDKSFVLIWRGDVWRVLGEDEWMLISLLADFATETPS